MPSPLVLRANTVPAMVGLTDAPGTPSARSAPSTTYPMPAWSSNSGTRSIPVLTNCASCPSGISTRPPFRNSPHRRVVKSGAATMRTADFEKRAERMESVRSPEWTQNYFSQRDRNEIVWKTLTRTLTQGAAIRVSVARERTPAQALLSLPCRPHFELHCWSWHLAPIAGVVARARGLAERLGAHSSVPRQPVLPLARQRPSRSGTSRRPAHRTCGGGLPYASPAPAQGPTAREPGGE